MDLIWKNLSLCSILIIHLDIARCILDLREIYKTATERSFQTVFGLKSFEQMENSVFRSFQFGFPEGLWASGVLPNYIWFFNLYEFGSHVDFRQYAQSIPVKYLDEYLAMRTYSILNSVLVDMQWINLTRKCSEIYYPRCSWHYFVNMVDPHAFEYSLVSENNHFLRPRRNTSRFSAPSESAKMMVTTFPTLLHGCYPITSLEQMSLIYIYAVCMAYRKQLDTEIAFAICPDRCRENPCGQIAHALTGSCHRLGIHRLDFSCSCAEGFDWDPVGQSCLFDDKCGKSCDLEGTSSCQSSRTNGEIQCICREGFMGHRCSEELNACLTGEFHPQKRTGLSACNTAEGGNTCIPIIGSMVYSCRCLPPFIADRNLPFDNCLARWEPCDSQICVYGSCVTSPDGLSAVCQCDLDYKGVRCDVPRGQWGLWEAWTACYPECGRNRQRWRLRNCFGAAGDCIGEREEIAMCLVTDNGSNDTTPKQCLWDSPPEQRAEEEFNRYAVKFSGILAAYLGVFVLVASLLSLLQNDMIANNENENDESFQKMKHRKFEEFKIFLTKVRGKIVSEKGSRESMNLKKILQDFIKEEGRYETFEETLTRALAIPQSRKEKRLEQRLVSLNKKMSSLCKHLR